MASSESNSGVENRARYRVQTTQKTSMVSDLQLMALARWYICRISAIRIAKTSTYIYIYIYTLNLAKYYLKTKNKKNSFWPKKKDSCNLLFL